MRLKSINFETIAFGLLFALMASTRLLYWQAVSGEPWWQTPGMDPEFYRNWALAINSGRGDEYLPFHRGPLFPYILALLYRLFGSGPAPVIIFNLTADLVTAWVVWKVTFRLGGIKAALPAVFFLIVSGAGIYYSGETLMSSLETSLLALSLFFYVRYSERQTTLLVASMGIASALFTLCRPNGIVLLPVIAVLLLRQKNAQEDRFLILKHAAIYLVLAVSLLLPATIQNYRAVGQFVPVATTGGVNLYIGNARGATGWASDLPGVGAEWVDTDAMRLASDSAGRRLNRAEESGQFVMMTLYEIAEAPLAWMKLIVKKVLLFVNIREIGNNRPFAVVSDSVPLVSVLFAISFGSLFPLALYGYFFRRKELHPAIPGVGFIFLAFSATIIATFVTTRYRLPLFPVVAIFAGVGLSLLFDELRQFKFPKRLWLPIIGLILVVPPWAGSSFDNQAQGYFVIGNALQKQGKYREALAYYDRVERLDVSYPDLNLNRGAAALRLGELNLASEYFQKELIRNPDKSDVLNNLGVIAETKGDFNSAETFYLRSLSTGNPAVDAEINLFNIYLKIGDRQMSSGNIDSAIVYYERADSLISNDPKSVTRLAIAYASTGDLKYAKELIGEVLRRDPEYLPALQLREQLGTISE